MLLDAIRSLLSPAARPRHTGAAPSAPSGHASPDPVALAACVLLLEIAHADGEFTDAERAHIETTLERHFSLPPSTGRALMEEAERERQRTVDHFSFTHRVKRETDHAGKMALAEAMWGLVLADGEIHEHEHYLTRKISNLLDLAPADLSAAKANAQANAQGNAARNASNDR